MAGEPKNVWASPNGTGEGTLTNPTDLVSALGSGADKVYIMDGIYEVSGTVLIPANLIVEAVSGARPIVVHTDGNPPALQFGAGCYVTGVWFGGVKFPDENGRIISFLAGGGAVIDSCTFFGYSQGMGGFVGSENQITRNRFVNCGYGGLYHDIYCSDSGATEISEGIHVGGQGYKIQLYGNPTGLTVHANFMGGAEGDMAIQQGPDTISNNILWGSVSYTYWNAGGCIFSKNIFGADRMNFADVSFHNTADGNVFCNGQTPFGTNAQVWDATAIETNLGSSKVNIDAAVATLKTLFEQTVQQIHDDTNIETHFVTLKSVIDAWSV